MNKIRVLIKEPGKVPRSVWISPTKENLEKHVGGMIVNTFISSDVVLISRAGAEFAGEGLTAQIAHRRYFGTLIFAGADGKGYADLPRSPGAMKKLFPSLWDEGKADEQTD